MFCNNCHQDLKDFGELLDKIQNCPLCGGQLIKTPPKVAQKGISELLNILVNNAGEKIYLYDDLLKSELEKIDAPEFENARDKLLLLTIKHIPSSMYKVKDFSTGEKQEVLETCSTRLMQDLGLQFEPSAEMLNILQERIWQKKLPLSQNSGDGIFKDPRDGRVYKTVKIGDQVWMKEELKYKCPFQNEDGLMYSKKALRYLNVPGWRLPTKDDVTKLMAMAKQTGYGDTSSTLMSLKSWEKFSVTPIDKFGFGAQPFKGCNYVRYWLKDGNVFQISIGSLGIATAFEAYVRLIKDDNVEESSKSKTGKKPAAKKAAACKR